MATATASDRKQQHLSGTERPKKLTPPLKWAGGKRWLVPHLLPIWARYSQQRLVEPFCGGLAVSLGLMPDLAAINDINPHVINFYRWLQQGLMITLLMENDKELYYQHRQDFNQLLARGDRNTKEAAEFFYYLNRTGYNGLCRFNKKGEFNVPFGKYKTINYTRDFSAYQNVFSGWEFCLGDLEQLELSSEDFVYADPPYDVEFTQYSKDGFSWDDQVRTAEWLARHSGAVLLSNQATDRILSLYPKLGFQTKLLSAPRTISCTGERSRVAEVLAWKNLEGV